MDYACSQSDWFNSRCNWSLNAVDFSVNSSHCPIDEPLGVALVSYLQFNSSLLTDLYRDSRYTESVRSLLDFLGCYTFLRTLSEQTNKVHKCINCNMYYRECDNTRTSCRIFPTRMRDGDHCSRCSHRIRGECLCGPIICAHVPAPSA